MFSTWCEDFRLTISTLSSNQQNRQFFNGVFKQSSPLNDDKLRHVVMAGQHFTKSSIKSPYL